MKSYLVTYDLRKPRKDYTSLHTFLKKYSGWAKPLESVWILKSPLTAIGVRDEIRRHLDADDGLLVVEVTKAVAAWVGVGDATTNWIKMYM